MNAIGTNDKQRFDAAAICEDERGRRFVLLDRHKLSAKMNAVAGDQGSKRRVKTGTVDHQIWSAIALFKLFTHRQYVSDLSGVPFTAVKRCGDKANAAQAFN